MVVEAEIFPVVLTCLKDKDEYVKKNASILIREIAKHTTEVKKKNFLSTIILVSFCCKVKHQFVYKAQVLCHMIWLGQGLSSEHYGHFGLDNSVL